MTSAPNPNTSFLQPPSPASGGGGDRPRARSRDFFSSSPLVQASIARDLAEDTDSDDDDAATIDSIDSEDDTPLARTASEGQAMTSNYRRQSFTLAGSGRAALVPRIHGLERNPTRTERHEARRAERSLLRDNNVIPPKHPQEGKGNFWARAASPMGLGIPGGDRTVVRPDQAGAGAGVSVGEAAGGAGEAAETTPLLGDPALPYGGHAEEPADIDKTWVEAVAAGRIKTTWQREAKVITGYSVPLVATFVLQYSLTVASVFVVGRLGTVELGAVSLAGMSASITGYAVYQGLATALDTLCAQAYGSGKKKLVGLQTQRMIIFLWVCTIPIAILWICFEWILKAVTPETEVAELAGLYLRVVLFGAPGYAAFESGKRYVQAQGLFSASFYVLLFCAPVNAFMNWLFVWKFEWGFVGAPIAVAITDCLLPLLLFLYVRFVAGRSCWPPLSRRVLHNWGPMVRLALPGLVMIEAEVFAFEILTFISAYFGTAHLAAQSVLATTASIAFQFPFPVSIATSTRIANLIGAALPDAARTAARVGLALSVVVGIFNFTLLSSLRELIPRLFSNDPEVIELTGTVLPLCAAFQLFDALAANCNGILRGLGRQEVGGYIQLFCYYVVAMPISIGTAFGLGWKLLGLWTGVALALGLVFIIEAIFIFKTSWDRSVEEARARNDIA